MQCVKTQHVYAANILETRQTLETLEQIWLYNPSSNKTVGLKLASDHRTKYQTQINCSASFMSSIQLNVYQLHISLPYYWAEYKMPNLPTINANHTLHDWKHTTYSNYSNADINSSIFSFDVCVSPLIITTSKIIFTPKKHRD